MAQEHQYQSINVTPNVTVLYPSSIFTRELQTPDGLMAILYDADHTTVLTISKAGDRGNAAASVRKFYEEAEQAKVTYFLDRPTFFVISGLKKNTSDEYEVFYFKRLRLSDGHAEIELRYPAVQKSQYDVIAEQILKSFVAHNSTQMSLSKTPARQSRSRTRKSNGVRSSVRAFATPRAATPAGGYNRPAHPADWYYNPYTQGIGLRP